MLSKKRLLIISGLLSLLLVVWNWVGNYSICDFLTPNGSLGSCPRTLTTYGIPLLPIFPFFLFALVTYFMREEVFRAWARFAVPAVLISVVLAYLTPTSTGSGFGPQISIGKGDTAFLMSVLFIFISIIIIIYKYWHLAKHK